MSTNPVPVKLAALTARAALYVMHAPNGSQSILRQAEQAKRFIERDDAQSAYSYLNIATKNLNDLSAMGPTKARLVGLALSALDAFLHHNDDELDELMAKFGGRPTFYGEPARDIKVRLPVSIIEELERRGPSVTRAIVDLVKNAMSAE